MTTISTITPHMRHESAQTIAAATTLRDELAAHPANSAARNLALTVPNFQDYAAAIELARQVDAWIAHIMQNHRITGRAIAMHGSLIYCMDELAAAVTECHYSQTA